MTAISLNTPEDYAKYFQHYYGFTIFPLQNPEALTVEQEPDEKKRKEHLKRRKKPAYNWELYQIMRPSSIQLERWFSKNPNYNIAALMGSMTGMVAFDVDSEAAKKRVYDKALEMSTNLRVALQNTMINRTGSGGGMHIVFRLEEHIDFTKEQLWTDGKPHSQILLMANGCYIVMPPSIHPSGARYGWNGKDPQLITKQELLEFIRLVSSINNVPKEEKPKGSKILEPLPSEKITRTLSPEKMQQLLDLIRPYYISGQRDFIIFYLSGAMRKEGFSLDTAKRFIKLLCNSSGYVDEDLECSLAKVDRTYWQREDEVIGKAGLYELLVRSYGGGEDQHREYEARSDTYSRICQILNPEPEPGDDPGPGNNKTGDFLGGYDDNRPGAWLRRQIEADNDIDPIECLTKEVMRLHRFRTLDDTKEILWYHNGRWERGGENRIKSLLDILGRHLVREHTRKEVIETTRAASLTSRDQFDKATDLVPCRNCVIDLNTGDALEHDPSYLFTYQIPWDYKPNEIRTCPRILQFFDEVMHRSDKRLVLEFIGYILRRTCNLQKALMCVGPPDQGKSKFLEMIEAFLGKENTSNKTLHQLTEHRFATAALFGKLANIFADLSNERLKDISMFNVLVAGDSISAEKKNKDLFDFKPFAKLLFSVNLPPLPPEGITNEDAFYKRWFVVSFMLKQGVKIDRNLLEKLTTDEEMSGLLYIAAGTARGLIKRGGFSKNPTIEETWEEYEKKANPIKAWVAARCIISERYQTDKDRLEADFLDYCDKKSLPGINNRVKFGKELKELCRVEDKKEGPKGKQKHVWRGIALRKDLREQGLLDLDLWGEGEWEEEA